jgi:hypothetical protein
MNDLLGTSRPKYENDALIYANSITRAAVSHESVPGNERESGRAIPSRSTWLWIYGSFIAVSLAVISWLREQSESWPLPVRACVHARWRTRCTPPCLVDEEENSTCYANMRKARDAGEEVRRQDLMQLEQGYSQARASQAEDPRLPADKRRADAMFYRDFSQVKD